MVTSSSFLTELYEKLVSQPEKWPGITTFINPYSYLQLRNNARILQSIDRVLVDGGLLVKILNSTLGLNLKRTSFDMTSLAPVIFEQCSESQASVFFVGSHDEAISQATKRFQKQFPKLNIQGFRNGYFTLEQRQAFINQMLELQPDVIICGMGTPQQEQMLIDLKHAGWQGAGFTCGGFFHQSAKKLNYYPSWVNRFNLRWLYRIYDEPKLLKRYTWDYSKFLFVYTYDLLCHLKNKNKIS